MNEQPTEKLIAAAMNSDLLLMRRNAWRQWTTNALTSHLARVAARALAAQSAALEDQPTDHAIGGAQ